MSTQRQRDFTDGSEALALYRQMYLHGSWTVEQAVAELGMSSEALAAALTELVRLGLVEHAQDGVRAHVLVGPEAALVRLLETERRRLREGEAATLATQQAIERIAAEYVPLRATTPSSSVEIELLTDRRRIVRVLDEFTQLVQEEVLSMHPGPLPPPELLAEGLGRDAELLARGVQIRSIYLRRFISSTAVLGYLQSLSRLGGEVRLIPVVPVRMMICDRRMALLPIDPADTAAGAIIIRGAALIGSLAAIYDYCWTTATTLDTATATVNDDTDQLTEEQRAVLRMLAAGMKDERIARSLGVSVRTVSRIVSELMEGFGVTSRFQAGVRATQLDLVQ